MVCRIKTFLQQSLHKLKRLTVHLPKKLGSSICWFCNILAKVEVQIAFNAAWVNAAVVSAAFLALTREIFQGTDTHHRYYCLKYSCFTVLC